MKTYNITFIGRLSGAIGLIYKIKENNVKAMDKEKAVLKLYDKYDDISVTNIETVTS